MAELPAGAAQTARRSVIPRLAPARLALLLAALALLAVPILAQLLDQPFYLRFATRVLVMALAAISLDLILGYGGMVSFGHAAFLGIGAYVTGILAVHAANAEPLLLWPVVLPGSDNAFIVWPLAMAAAARAACRCRPARASARSISATRGSSTISSSPFSWPPSASATASSAPASAWSSAAAARTSGGCGRSAFRPSATASAASSSRARSPGSPARSLPTARIM